jgi:abortive infection bacteriophage resistance protein
MGGRLYYGGVPMLKKPATYAEQVAKLREHGCVVSDEAFCEEILAQVSYYRLSAYFLPFRTSSGKYKSGTDFLKVYRLYEFDRKLRRLIFSVIEELEVYLRAQLSYYHAHKYGSDGYMNPANFNTRHNHARFTERVEELLKRNDKVIFVKHHMTEYGGQFPLWVLTELFTFGMLSYFYADMITADQKRIAYDTFQTTVSSAKSWLYCCTDLRNLCAHYGRLYYSVFSAVPAKLPNVDKNTENSLFAAIMALRALYPDASKWDNEFLPSMIALFDEYAEDIELRHIGFPENWEDIMRKQDGV